MNITVLFDEDTASPELLTGFGLSILVNNSVIFDTGSDGNSLLYNMKQLNIQLDKITSIVLSHEHWDHISGIFQLLTVLKNPSVYICPSFSKELKKEIQKAGGKIHMHTTLTKITKDIYTTGEISATYNGMPMPEQSLIIIRSPDHAALACGCSHYGLDNTIEDIKHKIVSYFNHPVVIDYVIGGFHLRNKNDKAIQQFVDSLRSAGIKHIAPLHCSGSNGKEYINTCFSDGFYNLKVGSCITV